MFKLNETDDDFITKFERFLDQKRESAEDVRGVVADIIQDVRENGDAALISYTKKFDALALEHLAFTPEEIDAEIEKISAEERQALEHAAARIEAYHLKQLPKDADFTDDEGARLGWHFSPMRRAGIYVPGGRASYPSSVLMNAIPAKVARVPDIQMCVPCPNGEINPLVLLAARLSGVKRIYKIGGAQAIAALAYGTASVDAVDVITGPGNAYVAEAKRQVYGHVGIDMVAGPSEVLIIADEANNPDWVAMDLLSQAEHDPSAQAILITDDAKFAEKVEAAVEAHLKTLSREKIARASWENNGTIIISKTLQTAAHLSNIIAPEHLEICTKEARALSHLTTEAGAIFLGALSPEAIGDYIAGPNHVLPTNRAARFCSGLSVLDYMKRTTIQEMSPKALTNLGPDAVILARSERLEAHARSVEMRLDELKSKE